MKHKVKSTQVNICWMHFLFSQNGTKQGDALSPMLFNFRIDHQKDPRKSEGTGTARNTSAPCLC